MYKYICTYAYTPVYTYALVYLPIPMYIYPLWVLQECVVEDIVAAEELPPGSASSDPLRGGSAQPSAQSLAFKISNKVPYKTVVKGKVPTGIWVV